MKILIYVSTVFFITLCIFITLFTWPFWIFHEYARIPLRFYANLYDRIKRTINNETLH